MFLRDLYHPIELESTYFQIILVLFIIASAIDHGYKLAVEKGSEEYKYESIKRCFAPEKKFPDL